MESYFQLSGNRWMDGYISIFCPIYFSDSTEYFEM